MQQIPENRRKIIKSIRIALAKGEYVNYTEFAKKRGFNVSMMSQWMTGKTQPSSSSLERLAAAFNMSLVDFLKLGES